MLASGWILMRAVDHDWRGYLLTLITVVLVLRTPWNPLWLLAAGALAGKSARLSTQGRWTACCIRDPAS
jgi:hypothetical protein